MERDLAGSWLGVLAARLFFRERNYIQTEFAVTTILVYTILVTLYLFWTGVFNKKRKRAEYRLETLKCENQNLNGSFGETDEHNRRLHCLWYDFHNMLSIACGLAESGEMEKAELLLEKEER